MGTQLDTFHLVDAPALVPYGYGIFSVAEPRPTLDPHWRLGVKWQSQGCHATNITTGPCIDPEVDALTEDDYCEVLTYEPFTVYAFNNDAIPGHTLAEHEQHAIDRLVNSEQRSVEEQLWTLMQTEAGGSTDLSGAPLDYVLGFIEQRAAEVYGGTAVIHMSRLTTTMLYGHLYKSGGRLVTSLGTPIVSGGGYDIVGASAPITAEIYFTGPLAIWRGDIDTRQNAVNKPVNEVSIVAQRDYVIGWDCVVEGVQFTLDQSTPDAS
jgi:hypothetical protein